MSDGFCPFCGKPAAAGARFCATCGKPLAGASAAAAPSSRQPAGTAGGGGETVVYELRPLVVRTLLELLVSVITLGVGLIFFWVRRWGCRYVVTSQRIEMRRGVVTVHRESLEMFRIEDFEVIEPFFLRMRGAGHLKIWSMDKDDPILVLEAIPDVQGVYATLRQLTREERGRNQVRVIETQ